jgi:hypothetical protein
MHAGPVCSAAVAFGLLAGHVGCARHSGRNAFASPQADRSSSTADGMAHARRPVRLRRTCVRQHRLRPAFLDVEFRSPFLPRAKLPEKLRHGRAAPLQRGLQGIPRFEHGAESQRQYRGTGGRLADDLVVPGRNSAEPLNVLGRLSPQSLRGELVQADETRHRRDGSAANHLHRKTRIDSRADLRDAAFRLGKGVLAIAQLIHVHLAPSGDAPTLAARAAAGRNSELGGCDATAQLGVPSRPTS